MHLLNLCHGTLLVALISAPLRAQQSVSDSVRFDRLAALGRLWSTVKYFHPTVADRPLGWDSALAATIPLVDGSADRAGYAAAVQRMLDAIGDPSTRVAHAELPGKVSRTAPGPVGRRLMDGTLLIEIHNYADLNDYPAVVDRLSVLVDSVRTAHAVIVDLRTSSSGDDPSVMGWLSYTGFDRALVSRPVQVPALRGRYYSGFAPMVGGTSGGYFSGDYTVREATVMPADSVAPKSVVFLVSEASLLPPVALALQEAGLGRIVMEGRASQAPAVERMQLGVGEGLFALVRTTDLVHADGSVGFMPDTLVPSAGGTKGDPALAAALALMNRPVTARSSTLAARAPPTIVKPLPGPVPEQTYDDTPYPAAPYRLLAAFRMWAVIRFFYAYRPLMGEDWDAVLRTVLPRFEASRDSLEYALAVNEMWAHIHDSHGYVQSPALDAYFGDTRPPVRLRMVEGRPVVHQLQPDSVARATGIRVGDVIVTVDGESARSRMARLARYTPASTPQAREHDLASRLLLGRDSTMVTVTVRGRNDRIRTVKLPRSRAFTAETVGNRPGPIVRRLTRDIGYVDLDRLPTSMVDSMFSALADTRAIVFDMRGYPQGTAWRIAPRLTSRPNVPAARFYRSQPMWRDTTEQITTTFIQTLPPADGQRYHGLTVMLIDERTVSQAEHTGLFLQAANGTRFIGSPTAGANGDVTSLVVPGGIALTFSGQGVEAIDGTRLQRVGLTPHVLIRPTIAGIRAGKDEVLERALAWMRVQLAN